MSDLFWDEYPENDLPLPDIGPCMKHGAMRCPECDSESFDTWAYNYGMDDETGYEDSGVRAQCKDCGFDADVEDFQDSTTEA